jgi:isopenicillin-N epimerase
MVPGGWDEVFECNHALAIEGRNELCRVLDVEPPAPDSMIGSISTLLLPPHDADRQRSLAQRPYRYHDALQDELITRHAIQVPLWNIPGWTPGAAPFEFSGRIASWGRTLRISAQLYNSMDQYRYLAQVLKHELQREASL